MKTQMFGLLLVFMLILALVPAVSAQDDTFLTCFNLPAGDCETLVAALENSASITSANITFATDNLVGGIGTVAMMMGGGEGAPMGDLTLTASGGGLMMEDAMAVPPAAMDFSLIGEFNDGMETDGGAVDVIMKDGVLYFSMDESPWMGMLFEELMDANPEMAGMMGGDEGLPGGALAPGDLMTGGDPADLLAMAGLGEDALALLETPGFIDAQRLADEQMMGQTMMVFDLVMDFGPLFASPDFTAVLNSSAAEMGEEAAQTAMMASMFLSGLELTVGRTMLVGADDMFVHGMDISIDAALDLSMLMGGGDTEMPPLTLTSTTTVMLDQINEAFDIQAPADATMVDPAEMGSLGF